MVIRVAGDPLALAPAAREAVRTLDPDLPVARIRTVDLALRETFAQRRVNMLLLGLFAALALLLAAVGIYGVMSYSVAQRTHELGIRLALGARSSDLTRLVVTQGLKLASLGLGLGLLGALAVTRLLSGLLYGVTASDPLTYLAIAGLLLVVALLACWVPARRAARTDPMIALRSE
jgi:putative ABC transport system permease protein